MDLALVSNNNFFVSSVNLIESFLSAEPEGKINYYCFQIDSEKLNLLRDFYGDRIAIREVEKVVDWAYTPKVFFYKVWAIHDCINRDQSFIYLDAGTEIVGNLAEFKDWLFNRTRVFIPLSYRYLFFKKRNMPNKEWTTNACFDAMGLNSNRYLEASQYNANIQAYLPTMENKKFVSDMYNCMLVRRIALPGTDVPSPEKENPVCRFHRCDQSVLSLLIEKYGWQQPAKRWIVRKYAMQVPGVKDQVFLCHRNPLRSNAIPKPRAQQILDAGKMQLINVNRGAEEE